MSCLTTDKLLRIMTTNVLIWGLKIAVGAHRQPEGNCATFWTRHAIGIRLYFHQWSREGILFFHMQIYYIHSIVYSILVCCSCFLYLVHKARGPSILPYLLISTDYNCLGRYSEISHYLHVLI